MTADDLFLPVTRDIIVACKARDRYFDLDAVREPSTTTGGSTGGFGRGDANDGSDRQAPSENTGSHPAGAPPLDWWNLPWQQIERRIVASMCPEKVCTTCGKPSKRIVKATDEYEAEKLPPDHPWRSSRAGLITGNSRQKHDSITADYITVGWTDCGHDTWRAGQTLVLTTADHDNLEGTNMTTRYLIGDTRNILATFESGSVDLVLSSPPFLALRSYLPADHPDKAHEIGSEATPGEFIDVLLDVVEACSRVLAPHGSLVFELGDTYAGAGGGGGDYDIGGLRNGQARFEGAAHAERKAHQDHRNRLQGAAGWPLDKSLTLVPQLFAYALAYGHNPLTGRQTAPWRIRNIVRWVRPNPPVGALGDKYRPATSELIVACKARDRYFDLDAVREPHQQARDKPISAKQINSDELNHRYDNRIEGERLYTNPAGAPPLDWWQIPTAPYKGSHYATWPPALCIRPILSMCPERVCTTCGKPSRRIVDSSYVGEPDDTGRVKATGRLNHVNHPPENGWERERTTLGWTDCQHGTWRPGHVLDPFAGSATTLAVAHGHGRDATGIDLDPRNAELAYGRLGMFLEVEDMREVPTGPTPHQSLPNPKFRAGYLRLDHPREPQARDYGAAPDGDVA